MRDNIMSMIVGVFRAWNAGCQAGRVFNTADQTHLDLLREKQLQGMRMMAEAVCLAITCNPQELEIEACDGWCGPRKEVIAMAGRDESSPTSQDRASS